MSVPPKNFSAEPTTQTSLFTKTENFYLSKVKKLFVFLEERKMNFLASVIATFLIEPQNALRAAYYMHRGLDAQRLVSLNPKTLSPEQLKLNPILAIHGDSSSSGIFAPMIDQIVSRHPDQPIFTIDLKSDDGIVSVKSHLHILLLKVGEIASLYPQTVIPTITFIGHSSGGDVIPSLVRLIEGNKHFHSGIIIKIASVFKKTEAKEFEQFAHEKVIEIVGTKDVLEGCKSYLSNKLVVNSGHLGLLFDQAVLDHISREISRVSF